MLILDFDGTLAHTKPIILNVLNTFIQQHHLAPVSEIAELHRLIYKRILKLDCRFFNIRRIKKTLQRTVLDEIQKTLSNIPLAHPDWAHCLSELHRANIKLAILTSNRRNTVKRFLQIHQLQSYFCSVVHSRNKRLALLKLMDEYNANPQQTFYLGDQAGDIKAARGVCRSIAVSWGFDKATRLTRYSPSFIIDNPSMLLDYFDFLG